METLESSRVCRLCGQHSGICINIFDKNENHVKKINAVLPILVHEMDLLPKQMCHRCSYKLEEFHKFYADCLKTDMNLKSQLSWMRKMDVKEDVRVPMVQIENVKLKSEPPDYDIYELDPIVENVNYIRSMSPMTYSMNGVRNNNVNECNKRFRCDDTFANCSHFNCNYCKTDSRTDRLDLPMNRLNEVKRNVRRDNPATVTAIDRRGVTNTFKNTDVTDGDRKDLRKADNNKRSSTKVNRSHNTDKVLTNVGQVPDVKIKTEIQTAVETRSLRPRKKSVDYLGRKRKKDDNNVIANPAKRCATSANTKEKRFAGSDSTTNKVTHVIRKELIEEVCGHLLRPRTLTVDYLGRKRRVDTGIKKNWVKDVVKKKEKFSMNKNKGSRAFGKCSSGSVSEKKEFKVKEEVLSDVGLPDVEQENDVRYNIGLAAGNHVRNLKNFFDRDGKTSIKIKDEDIVDGYTDRDDRVNVSSLASEPMKYPKYKSMLRNVAAKKLFEIEPSENRTMQKMQNLGVKNGKMKKSQPNRSSIKNLQNRLAISQLRTTRNSINSNLRNDAIEIINRIRVPKSLKTEDNIKHFCEKCCSSFLNRELYTLHVCYFA